LTNVNHSESIQHFEDDGIGSIEQNRIPVNFGSFLENTKSMDDAGKYMNKSPLNINQVSYSGVIGTE